MNTRLPLAAGCAALAAIGSVSLGGCAAGLPSGALTATAGSGGVASVYGAPLLVAPEDFEDHNFHGGGEGRMRAHAGDGHGGMAVGASGDGGFGARGAMGKGR